MLPAELITTRPRRAAAALFVLLTCIGLAALTLGAAGVWLVRDLPGPQPFGPLLPDVTVAAADAPATGLPVSVQVLDADGELLRLFTTPDGYWRLPAQLDAIDPRFITQLIAYEDQRFWQHPGVDPWALLRALGQWLWHGEVVSGASTLTMQTVRLLQPRPRTLASKLTELRLALALERRYSKRQILALYLTLAPYGGNLQGIRAASRFYFGKEPRRLTPSESALLLALPQAPEARRPDRAPAAARAARERVLTRLAGLGLLSADRLAAARQAPLPTARRPTPQHAAHLADALRRAQPGQGRLHTTLDGDLQRRLEQLAQRWQSRLLPGESLAVMVVANPDRRVLATVGSGDYLTVSQLDLTTAVRSPGSTLKPLIYGLGFETGRLHPLTRVWDRQQAVGDYAPANFDARYRGLLSLAEALQLSLNTAAVQVLAQVGPQTLLDRLGRCGLRPRLPDPEPAALAVGLGGVGLQLRELVTLYAALADGGHCQPLRSRAQAAPAPRTRLLTPAAHWYLDQVLQQVPSAAARRARPGLRLKTGTSYGHRDAWALGYDAGYTVGVWVGDIDGRYGERERTGAGRAVPLLRAVFAQLPPVAPRPLSPPPGVLQVASAAELPPGLRWLAADADPGQGPRVLFPPDRSDLRLPRDAAAGIPLEVAGGDPPYHWLIDGRPLADNGHRLRQSWRPEGPGRVRITVLDARGRSDSVSTWLVAAEPPAAAL